MRPFYWIVEGTWTTEKINNLCYEINLEIVELKFCLILNEYWVSHNNLTEKEIKNTQSYNDIVSAENVDTANLKIIN